MERDDAGPEPGPMNAAGTDEASRSVAGLRTAGVAIALVVIGLLSLGSAWCGHVDPETTKPLLMETTERQASPAPPVPPVRP